MTATTLWWSAVRYSTLQIPVGASIGLFTTYYEAPADDPERPPTDPDAPLLTLTKPSGSTVEHTSFAHVDGSGRYETTVTFDEPGQWLAVWSAVDCARIARVYIEAVSP